MTTQEPTVPQWFADFMQENDRRHAELIEKFSHVEGQLRVLKRLGYAIVTMALASTAGIVAAAAKYVFGF